MASSFSRYIHMKLRRLSNPNYLNMYPQCFCCCMHNILAHVCPIICICRRQSCHSAPRIRYCHKWKMPALIIRSDTSIADRFIPFSDCGRAQVVTIKWWFHNSESAIECNYIHISLLFNLMPNLMPKLGWCYVCPI